MSDNECVRILEKRKSLIVQLIRFCLLLSTHTSHLILFCTHLYECLRHQCANKFPKAHKQSSASNFGKVRERKNERKIGMKSTKCMVYLLKQEKKVTFVLKIFVS